MIESSVVTSCVSGGLFLLGGAAAYVALYNGGPIRELHERAHQLMGMVLTTGKVTVETHVWKQWSEVSSLRDVWNILTDWGHKGSTHLGAGKSLLPEDWTMLLFYGAGPAFELVLNATALGAARRMWSSSPKIAALLAGFGLSGMTNQLRRILTAHPGLHCCDYADMFGHLSRLLGRQNGWTKGLART